MKKRMRKLISVIGVTVLAVSLFAGCGNSDQQGSSSKSDSSASAESTGEVMSNEDIIKSAAEAGTVGNWGLGNEYEIQALLTKYGEPTFQALRIDVNREFEVLYEFMEKLPGALKPGGRAAILTFHSGEDKLVKKALKAGYKEGIYSDYSRDVIRPSAQECAQNGRARSTKMRWAIKSE